MKKILALALTALVLLSVLTGCSGGDAPASTEQGANFQPDAANLLDSVSGEEEPTAQPDPILPDALDEPLDVSPDATVEAPLDNPFGAGATADPNAAPSAAANPYSYSFAALADTSFGFTFNYPTSWENLPGKYTVCFRQIVDQGQFPARVAVTKKTLAHKPKNSNTVLKQFQNYAQLIYAQYDAKTFEFGDLNSDATFMGQSAFEISYLAYSGSIEVEGYMICCAVDSDLYVFHFCAPREDFEALTPTMTRMRDSMAVVQ